VFADRVAGATSDAATLGTTLAERMLEAGADTLLKSLAMDGPH
jgi:hypothetical protein